MMWHALSSQLIHTDGGDDTWLVYNKLSGDTHLLNFFSKIILENLANKPMNLDDLLQYLNSLDEWGGAEISFVLLQKTVSELDKLGLIHPYYTGNADAT